MSDERFMRHQYGPSGYVKPSPAGDSPLTPWGEQLARVQAMCTEGYGGLSGRDKSDIRAVYHRMLDLTREVACPCCKSGTTLLREPCQECHGKGLVSVAYDTLRVHYKSLQEYSENIKNALRDALDVVEVAAEWLRGGERVQERDAANVCDEVVAYARGLGVRRNCPAKDASCPCQDGDACHYEGPDAWPLLQPQKTESPDWKMENVKRLGITPK